MNTYYAVRSPRPAERFSFGFLNGRPARLRRPGLRDTLAGYALELLLAEWFGESELS